MIWDETSLLVNGESVVYLCWSSLHINQIFFGSFRIIPQHRMVIEFDWGNVTKSHSNLSTQYPNSICSYSKCISCKSSRKTSRKYGYNLQLKIGAKNTIKVRSIWKYIYLLSPTTSWHFVCRKKLWINKRKAYIKRAQQPLE